MKTKQDFEKQKEREIEDRVRELEERFRYWRKEKKLLFSFYFFLSFIVFLFSILFFF